MTAPSASATSSCASTPGAAKTTTMFKLEARAVDGFGPPDEGVDERVGDVMEDGSDDPFEDRRGEFVSEIEFDFARVGIQRAKPPLAVQAAEWPAAQRDADPRRR